MTTAETPAIPAQVEAQPESRLEQLASLYTQIKPLADQYAAQLKEITDAIKYELAQAAPGSEQVVLNSQYLDKPLRMSHRVEWRLNSKQLKQEDPVTWVKYARQVESWRLEQAR